MDPLGLFLNPELAAPGAEGEAVHQQRGVA
jgi:hypothetical protein